MENSNLDNSRVGSFCLGKFFGTRTNEDVAIYGFHRTSSTGIFGVIADGLGSLPKSGAASASAAELVKNYLLQNTDQIRPSFLRNAMIEAHAKIDATFGNENAGTTLTIVVSEHQRVLIAHIGDSRALLVLPTEKAQWITQDHSKLADQTALPNPPLELVKSSKSARWLTRSLGDVKFEPHWIQMMEYPPLCTGHLIVLCTDGVWTEFSPDELADLAKRNHPSEAARHIVETAMSRDNTDDCACVIIRG